MYCWIMCLTSSCGYRQSLTDDTLNELITSKLFIEPRSIKHMDNYDQFSVCSLLISWWEWKWLFWAKSLRIWSDLKQAKGYKSHEKVLNLPIGEKNYTLVLCVKWKWPSIDVPSHVVPSHQDFCLNPNIVMSWRHTTDMTDFIQSTTGAVVNETQKRGTHGRTLLSRYPYV